MLTAEGEMDFMSVQRGDGKKRIDRREITERVTDECRVHSEAERRADTQTRSPR